MTTLTLGDLSFEVRHSTRRQTIGITVERDGQLVIACRPDVPLERVEQVIQDKRLWIYEKLLQKESLNPPAPPLKEYVSGESFYYLGRSHRLKLVDPIKGQHPLRLHQSRFFLHRTAQPQGRALFIEWYRVHLQSILTETIAQLTSRIGVKSLSVQVRELGYRWGSCSQKGEVYFHWRVAMLPRPMIDYVVTHELVHLIEHQHSPRFWDRLEQVIPDFASRKDWLAAQGSKYDL
jgi:predicted metal-dependent hydrolase